MPKVTLTFDMNKEDAEKLLADVPSYIRFLSGFGYDYTYVTTGDSNDEGYFKGTNAVFSIQTEE